MVVTKDTVIAEVIMADENVAPLLMSMGLHCLGCAMASGESLEDACMVHGIDVEDLVNEINKYFEENPEPKEAQAEF